jgi:hypothetical protein
VGEPAEPSTSIPQQGVKAAEMAYAKSDFVPGDEIIFDDNQAGEQLGEFPSMWDLVGGNAEIVSMDGQKGIMILDAGKITPLMKTPKSYLTDQFTIEFDYYKRDKEHSSGKDGNNRLHVYLLDESGKEIFQIGYFVHNQDGGSYNWKTASGENLSGEYTQKTSEEAWHHVAYSFNKRAFKAYLDGSRIVNIPNMGQAKWIRFNAYSRSSEQYFIRNVRIAKGAVPLYDRMMSAGKGQNSPIADNATDEGRAKNRRVEFVQIK